MVQKQQAYGTKPHKRNSGSFKQPIFASHTSNSGSFQKTNSNPFQKSNSVPLADNPYARSSSAIYTGGERAIFRNQELARRNKVVLRVMAGLCILMIAVLIGFALGKGAGLAEADTNSPADGAATPITQVADTDLSDEANQNQI